MIATDGHIGLRPPRMYGTARASPCCIPGPDSVVHGQTGVKELHQDAALSPFRYGAVDELDERADAVSENGKTAAFS